MAHLSVQSALLGFVAMTIWINQLEQNVNLEFVLLNVFDSLLGYAGRVSSSFP